MAVQATVNQSTSPTTSTESRRVLIVEDDELLAAYFREVLNTESWDSVAVATGQAGMELLRQGAVDVLLLDIYLPDMTGIDLLRFIREEGISVEVVAMTSQGSMELAIEAMREGAYDFLEKPIENDRLLVTMGNALKHLRLAHTVKDYEKAFRRDRFHGLLGASLPMQSVFRIIESAAPSKATVFIMGESGTGKELCAEAIHKQSPRTDGPFVTLNCAAIPKDDQGNKLFDLEYGAASRADGGTLFLDEICEMDLDLQSKFLRFFQSQRFQKVGGNKEIEVDVRLLCATNRDPQEEVRVGRFREDLFYRLHVVPIVMPPLRDRGEDVLLIARCFLLLFAKEEGKGFQRFSPEVEAIFLSYEWPGNVRELQNVVRNMVVLHDGEVASREMLPPPLNMVDVVCSLPHDRGAGLEPAQIEADMPPMDVSSVGGADMAGGQILPLWQVEMNAIEGALHHCDGNIQQAAELLDINPSTIYRKRKKWLSPGG